MNEIATTLLTAIVTSIFSSGVVGAVVAHVIKKIEERDVDKKVAKEADKLLLLDLLNRTASKHKTRGFISQTDFEVFEASYKCYKACGGDGWADCVLSEIKALPKVL